MMGILNSYRKPLAVIAGAGLVGALIPGTLWIADGVTAALPDPTRVPISSPSLQSDSVSATPASTPGVTPAPSPPALPPIEPLLFVGGGVSLLPGSESIIDQVADVLTAHPEVAVSLVGHTDSGRTNDIRVRLGQARADAIADALVERGIAASRIVTASRADLEPVATNATAEGRSRNRRVTVTWTAAG